MTLETAIMLLTKEYESANKQKRIRDPLAYALYQTWRKADFEASRRAREEMLTRDTSRNEGGQNERDNLAR